MGNIQGIFYDTAQYAPETFTKVSIDSVLELNTSTNFGPPMKRKIANDSLISSELSADKMRIVERYIPKIKKDLSYSDTTVLTYEKRLNGIHFSFSNEMDSTRKMKLAKIELKFSAIPNDPEKYRRLPRQVTLEIKEIPIRDQGDIITIFNKLDSLTRNKQVSSRKGGRVRVYKKFWNDEQWDAQQVASPLLTYSDLMINGNPRCVETAEMIFVQYLKKEFSNDK